MYCALVNRSTVQPTRRHAETDAVFDMTVTLAHRPIPPILLLLFKVRVTPKELSAMLCF